MNEDCFHLGIKALIRRGGEILLLKVNTKVLSRVQRRSVLGYSRREN